MYVNYRYGAAMLHYFVLLKNLKIFYNFVLMKSKITNHVCLCSGPGRTWICRTYSVSWRVGYREAKWCRVAVASCRVAWRVVAGAVGGMARVSRLTAGGASAARGALTRSVATPPRRPRAPKFFGNFARQVEMRDAASFLRLTDFAIGNRFLGINCKTKSICCAISTVRCKVIDLISIIIVYYMGLFALILTMIKPLQKILTI